MTHHLPSQRKSFSLTFVSRRSDGFMGVEVRTIIPIGYDEFGRYRCLAPHEVVSSLRRRNPQLMNHPDILVMTAINGRLMLTIENLDNVAAYRTFLRDSTYLRMSTGGEQQDEMD